MQRITSINQLSEWVASQNKIMLYGAGAVGKLVLSYLEETGNKEKIKCFVESDPESGKKIKSISVHRLEDIDTGEGTSILITTTEKLHDEIMQTIKNVYDENVRITVITDSCIGFLRYIQNIKQSVIRQGMEYRGKIHNDITTLLEKVLPLRQLAFSVHLCEHCNLNCAGCNNFSPLANENYTDINQFEADIKRLAELSDGDAYRIQLTGGEPLLNPKAIEYAIIARKYFPNARIAFISNGTLLKKQKKEFFEKCVKYRIEMDLTPYPIEMDYEELSKFLEQQGIKWKYQNGNAVKKWRKEVFDLNPNNPKSPVTHNWLNCYMANNCIQLNNGKLMCTKISNAHYFMEYFKDQCSNMYITSRDYIDIYNVQSIEEIFDFFSRPFPFCKYCKMDVLEEVEWSVSKKRIEEWT